MGALTNAAVGDRWLDEVIVHGTLANLDGDRVDTLVNPLGEGSLAIMEIAVFVDQIATLVATPIDLSVFCDVVDSGSGVRDIIGVEKWQRINAAMIATYFSPDPLVEWREGESIRLIFQEVDTNAAPTADLTVRVKCARVRPVAGAAGPIRLVR